MSRRLLLRCAAVLLAAILGLAVADNARPWKRLQAELLDLERRDLRARLDEAKAGAAGRLAELEAEIEAEETRLVERRDEIRDLERDLRRFRGKRQAARWRWRQARAKVEEAGRRPGEDSGETGGEPSPAPEEELRQARMEVESLDELIEDRERKLGALRADLDQARERRARELAPIADLEERLAELGNGPLLPFGLLSTAVAVREVPVADFPGPDGSERLDRCTTCHLGAARDGPGRRDGPPLARPHPRPELFLSAGSPHPHGRFGCTVCHGGEGRSTDFSRSGHVPARAGQEAAESAARGPRPMLPLELTEAACGRCHGGEVWTPEAPVLDAGRRLIAALGCTGCHPSSHPALRALPKAGPALAGIAGKTRPAWAYRWLGTSLDGAASTGHFFDREDRRGAPDPARRAAEIRAVVHALWERSRPDVHEPPPAGDAEAGRALFHAVGCAACHVVDPAEEISATAARRHGPELARIGSKVSPGWLYAWLRDPGAYRHDTPMPSLRLDEGEAADLTAYLMSRRDPAWEGLELPPAEERARDALALARLEEEGTVEAARARLDAMSERERSIYAGERTIARHGCHGCHEISGFAGVPPPGPPLELVAGRRFGPSHRPGYLLDDAATRAVNVALIGLGSEPIVAAVPSDDVLTAGRRILARYNCRGCHRIEGRGAADRERPRAPDLTHAGARLRSPWLLDYLADPARFTVRPWLELRMPSFRLSDDETHALTRYFAARDGRDLLTAAAPDPPPGERQVAVEVGRVVFNMLQCGGCHHGAEEAEPDREELAPSYRLARQRLRPDWVRAWILDPERWQPQTPMPANFKSGKGAELDSSFLIGSISTPIFAVERDRLLRLFASEAELHSFLADPERVAEALADYLWTLGE